MTDTKPTKSAKAKPEQPTTTPSSTPLSAKASTTKDNTARSASKPEANTFDSAKSKSEAPKTEGKAKREQLETTPARPATTSRMDTKKPSTQAVAPGPSSKESGVIDTATALPDAKEIYRMTAEAAYYLAEKRNFAPGHEQEDWEVARAEVMARLEKRKG